ncbi:MAG: hypothetical protein ACREBU_24115 [Nitrososphaera sp.]
MTDSSSFQSGDKTQSVTSLKDLQTENSRLKRRLRHLQFMSTMSVGLGLIGAGGLSLVLSYFASSVILTLAGLGLVFWGVILLYISPSRYVPEKVLSGLSVSMIKSIDRLLVNMNYRGKTIFVHPRILKGLAQGYVFIPYDNVPMGNLPSDEQLAEEKVMYEDPKGIFMVAPSQGLVELIEKELDSNLTTVDMAYLRENLPKLLVNNLRLVDSVAIEEPPELIRIKITGETAARVCRTVSKETLIGDHFGCPLCSALGLIISKVTGKPVSIMESRANEIENTISTTYRTLQRSK